MVWVPGISEADEDPDVESATSGVGVEKLFIIFIYICV